MVRGVSPLVAGVAVGSHLFDLDLKTMLYLEVAVRTIHLVLRHVLLVDEVDVIELGEARRLVMAGERPLPWPTPSPVDRPGMTALAAHREPSHIGVIESKRSALDHPLWSLMAQRASRRSLVQPLASEVAEHARRGCDSNVAALDDLRMAGSTAELLPPPHLGEVGCMIEQNVAINLLAEEETLLVTAETARGPSLCVDVCQDSK